MENWKDMAKRLRKNSEENLRDYPRQAAIAEERAEFLRRIQAEKDKVISDSKRKRYFQKTPIQEDIER